MSSEAAPPQEPFGLFPDPQEASSVPEPAVEQTAEQDTEQDTGKNTEQNTEKTQDPLKDARTTPMLAQYFKVKETHPDCLLFFRMGDFFELFFEDAEVAAPILQIQLTQRGSHEGKPVVMCGVPVRAADSYLGKLIRQGHRVALCDQIESAEQAKRRGGKQIVRREVVRLVTPGTLLEDSLLEGNRNNYLLALARARGAWGVAWADISTGVFCTCRFAAGADGLAKLSALLVRLEPAEILLTRAVLPDDTNPSDTNDETIATETNTEANTQGSTEKTRDSPEADTGKALLCLPRSLVRTWKQHFTYLEEAQVSVRAGTRCLTTHFKVRDLSAFGSFSDAEVAAAGALLDYAASTTSTHEHNKDSSAGVGLAALRPPRPESESETLQMDSATRRNLELVRGAHGGRRTSLLARLDRTTTAAGARLLSSWLAAPLTDLEAISARQDMVAWFLAQSELATQLREALKQLPDLERAVARLAGRRGGPRDLAAVAAGLTQAHKIAGRLGDAGNLPQRGEDALAALTVLDDLAAVLTRAVLESPPFGLRDGDFVRRGYDPRLDELRSLRDDGTRRIAALQEQYLRASGVSSLRIRHNRILGYYIEVSTAQAEKFSDFIKAADDKASDTPLTAPHTSKPDPKGKVPSDGFRHRQTMANAVRYGSIALGQLESDLTQAAARVASLQEEIFARLSAQVVAEASTLTRLAAAVAETDCLLGLSLCAAEESWIRPTVDDSRLFVAEAARHPVVEAARSAERETFIANDCTLEDTKRLWLLTGPNMAGKSTFLRQNALLVVLAQAGSFVPAQSFRLGRVRRLFSRVGAADDLARGRSTFMAEMLETATILNLAGAEDFIILDELGRGTATHDGLSLAWATVEHLHQHNQTRTLFATHYHELTGLAQDLPHCFAATMAVREWHGDIVFLHKVQAGAAEGSYGLHVARLAGVPAPVVQRAASLLADFEAGKLPKVSLKSAPPAPSTPPHPAVAALTGLRPDSLSPREALEALYALKQLATEGEKEGKEEEKEEETHQEEIRPTEKPPTEKQGRKSAKTKKSS